MVNRWDIVTIGNLSRNRYWSEGDERPVRAALCTTTLLTGEGWRLLVDPAHADAATMAAELDRRTGLGPDDVDAVFLTHAHGDHHAGLGHFARARWLAAPGVAEAINRAGVHDRHVEPAPDKLFGEVDVIAAPGHTPDHHALRFDCDGLSVVVAGDAVMTRDFWADRRGFFNSADFAQAARTIDEIARVADAVVPGHDNWFLVPRRTGKT